MVESKDDAGSKEKFLEQVRRAGAEAKRVDEAARQLQNFARLAGEIADATRKGFSALPNDYLSGQDWARYTSVWQGLEQSAVRAMPDVTFSNTFGAVTYNAATTSNTVMYSSGISTLPNAPVIWAAQGQLSQILDRTRLLDDARTAIRRLGLDRPSGGGTQTALTHLEATQRSLGSGAAPVLVSMREAIETAVRQLIARRPTQEKGSSHKDKVTSLGRQCGREGIRPSDFAVLASIGHDLINKLSGSKDKVFSDQQISELLYEGLVHLNALLGSLDESRLKPV